ncbi:hypothetical protein EKJ_01270 [Qipengyuania flava]|uniref:Uncharacterized protein n=1 Tax=Qipengyuania flava TaxID=192812 RepID=A0A3T1CE70_9SPHN|nr:hypothetical protein EKJ_01270 [Qipengyuania flava]
MRWHSLLESASARHLGTVPKRVNGSSDKKLNRSIAAALGVARSAAAYHVAALNLPDNGTRATVA